MPHASCIVRRRHQAIGSRLVCVCVCVCFLRNIRKILEKFPLFFSLRRLVLVLEFQDVTFGVFIESPMAIFHGCHTSSSHCNPHHPPNHPFTCHPFHTAIHQQPFLQHLSPLFPHTPHPFVHPVQFLGIDFESTHKMFAMLVRY